MKRTKRSDKEILDDLEALKDQIPPGTTVERLIGKAKKREHKFRQGRSQMGALIDQSLWHEIKIQAAKEGRATGFLIDDAIKLYLAQVGEEQP